MVCCLKGYTASDASMPFLDFYQNYSLVHPKNRLMTKIPVLLLIFQYSPFHLLCHHLLLHWLVWSDDVVTSGAKVVLPSGEETSLLRLLLFSPTFPKELIFEFFLSSSLDVILVTRVRLLPILLLTVTFVELLFQFLSCHSTFVTFPDLERSYSSDMSLLTLLPFQKSSFLLTSPFLETFCRKSNYRHTFLKDKGQL